MARPAYRSTRLSTSPARTGSTWSGTCPPRRVPVAAIRCRIRPGSRPRCGPSAYARTGRSWPTTPTTSLAAARLWWLLTDAGHDAVRVLNGGLAAWRAAGLPTESGPARPRVPGDFVARPGQRAPADRGRRSPPTWPANGGCGWSTSGRPSATPGEAEPIDPVAGHIPGAVNLPSVANLAADGRFLDGRRSPGASPRPGLAPGRRPLLRVRGHRRAEPARPGVGRSYRRDLPGLVERLDHRSAATGRHRVSVSAWDRRT